MKSVTKRVTIMTTISAKELRENLSDYLKRSAGGEEIEVRYHSQPIVRLSPAGGKSQYTGDKVGERLDKLLQKLPETISAMMQDPDKTYKQLRDEAYRRDSKYRRYLSNEDE